MVRSTHSTTRFPARSNSTFMRPCKTCCSTGWSGSCAMWTCRKDSRKSSGTIGMASRRSKRPLIRRCPKPQRLCATRAAPNIVVSDYFDRLALDRALDSIGDAERRLTAAMVANGHAGADAVEEWVRPRQAEVERIRSAIHQIAGSGLTLSKLSVAASLLGDLARQ